MRNLSIAVNNEGGGYFLFLFDLQQCLKREENAQTGARGLEPGEDLQVNHNFKHLRMKPKQYLKPLLRRLKFK